MAPVEAYWADPTEPAVTTYIRCINHHAAARYSADALPESLAVVIEWECGKERARATAENRAALEELAYPSLSVDQVNKLVTDSDAYLREKGQVLAYFRVLEHRNSVGRGDSGALGAPNIDDPGSLD